MKMLETYQKRVDRDRSMRVEDFLCAAEGLFARKGFHETSMDDIARAAGYATGTIYRYFESKDVLFRELFSRRVTAFFSAITDAVDMVEDPRTAIRRLVHAKVDFFRENSAFLTIYLRYFHVSESVLMKRKTSEQIELKAAFSRKLREQIRRGIDAGFFQCWKEDYIVSAFSGITNELLISELTKDGESPDLDKVEEFCTRFIESALLVDEHCEPAKQP